MLEYLNEAVGSGKPNWECDVRLVQKYLNRNSFITHISLMENGRFCEETMRAIIAFQRHVLKMTFPDGVVDTLSPTEYHLLEQHGPNEGGGVMHPAARALRKFPVQPGNTPKSVELTEDDYQKAADRLKCEVAAIKAVVLVETPGGAFDSKGRPVVLYERHLFRKHTKGRYDRTHPDLSGPPYAKSGYGALSIQYKKLERAYALDPAAALKSASWGRFQILESPDRGSVNPSPLGDG